MEKLLHFLLYYKLDMNSIVHRWRKKEQEFNWLIQEKEGLHISQ